jgi:cytochrome c oxidase subunit 4
MSSSTPAHDAHGHGGADHVPHVLPLAVYFKTYGALLMLTAVTFGASYLHLGDVGGLIVAMGIATMKATVVAMIFMHLYWDQKFFAIIFTSSLLFLAIFLAFTMFDTNERGIADPVEKDRPADYKTPFTSGTQEEAKFKAEAEEQKKIHEDLLKTNPREFAPAPAPAPAVAPGAAPAVAPAPAPVEGAPAAAPPPAPGAAPAATPPAATPPPAAPPAHP